jgi:hypothetical protein
MDEIQLPRRQPGAPQPARHCRCCGQPLVVAGTRVVWVRGALHAFDRCAGCRREGGRPATVEEWQRLGFIKQPHVKGMGIPGLVDIEDEPLWDGVDDEEGDEQASRIREQALPGWIVALGLVLGGAGLALLTDWAGSRNPPDDET